MLVTDATEITPELKQLGWHSMDQIRAFKAYMDHRDGCEECKKPGPGVLLDDGYQPTCNECDTAVGLYRAYLDTKRPSTTTRGRITERDVFPQAGVR